MPRGTPSTQINITLGAEGLSEKAAMLQSAARQAQIEKERTQRIAAEGAEKREASQAAKGRAADGYSLYSNSPNAPQIQRRPAASRFIGQGLNLGHLWLFRDTFNILRSTGINEVSNAQGRSRTGTRAYSQRQNVLLGSGDGSTWITFSDLGYGPLPQLPTDTFSVSGQTNPPENPINVYEIYFYGTRLSGRGFTGGFSEYRFALPCGNGNFIFIYGYSSAWDTYETNAYYAARALYSKDGDFLGYFNITTGNFDSSTIPDDLLGYFIGVNNGIVSLTGYTDKERRVSAYICNNSIMREISVPATLQSVLDVAYPDPILTTKSILYRAVTYSYSAYQIAGGLDPFSPYGDSGKGYTNGSYGGVFTPEIFASINEVYEFTPASTIKSFSDKLKWGLTDNSEGAYARFKDVDDYVDSPYWSIMYNENLPFYHALWPNKNEEPDLSIWDPDYADQWATTPKPKRVNKATLELNPSRVSRPGASDLVNFGGGYWTEDMITVWDWDDPAYCRSMCKALGFTDADLTP